jgi:hypothetical protein
MAGVHCPNCHGLTEVNPATTPQGAQPFRCRHCGAGAEVEAFPVLGRGLLPGRTGVATVGDEAACFFHADKRAECACDQCGRYICALCDIQVGERHFCPQCFGGDPGRPAPSALTERERSMPGRLAFWMAVVTLFLGPLGSIGGPIAVWQAIRGLRAPRSVTGGRATGMAVVGLVLGLMEGGFWLVMIATFFFGIWREAMR